MNESLAIFLFNKHVRGMRVTYEAEHGAKRDLVKTLDQEIDVDDYVVVETDTRHNMTVCKVVEVDVEPEYDSLDKIRWVVDRVDRSDFEHIAEQEAEAIARIKSAEKRSLREKLAEKLLADANGDLKELPIYTREESGS